MTPPLGCAVPSVGVVAPYDFALDRELWRWVPDPVSLLIARTPYESLPVSLAQARAIGDVAVIADTARRLATPGPGVVAYACTSGSFVRGAEGEQAIVAALLSVGIPRALTTSGAMLAALTAVGAHRVCIATPYDAAVTALLVAFLDQAGFDVASARHLGLTGEIWAVAGRETAGLIRDCYVDDCDAVFVSCTNLPTYDVIAPLEAELGVPVISANQATMWAALGAVGVGIEGAGQRLAALGAAR